MKFPTRPSPEVVPEPKVTDLTESKCSRLLFTVPTPKKTKAKILKKSPKSRHFLPLDRSKNPWQAEYEEHLDIISAQRKLISDQKMQIQALEDQLKKIEEERTKSNEVHCFLSLIQDLGLVISASTLQNILLLWAKDEKKLSMVKNYWWKIRHVAKKNLKTHLEGQVSTLVESFRSYRHLYKTKETISELQPALLLVNGHPMLKRFEDGGLIYINDQLKFDGATVICAHADGKFSSCPRNFVQSFQLRLRLLKEGREFTVLFASGLLSGSKTENYREFFDTCKAYRCPAFPYLIADYEIGISNAAKDVWKGVKVRGCNFHYMQNLLRMKRKLQRWIGQTPSDFILNVLYLLPFIKRPFTYLRKYIEDLDLSGDHLFKNVDFKLLLYVFSTYCERLQNIFSQDLKDLGVKTNNSCEGFNSRLQKAFSKKPQVHEFAAFISSVFKMELFDIRSFKQPQEHLGDLLKNVQECSTNSLSQIMNFCSNNGLIKVSRSSELLAAFRVIDFSGKVWISKAKDKEDREFLKGIVIGYKAFCAEKRRQLEALHREKIRPLVEELDFKTLLEDTESGSKISFVTTATFKRLTEQPQPKQRAKTEEDPVEFMPIYDDEVDRSTNELALTSKISKTKKKIQKKDTKDNREKCRDKKQMKDKSDQDHQFNQTTEDINGHAHN